MNKNIAFFFLSLSFYQTGNWLQNTALNFSVYSSTGSTLKVGIVQFLQYAPFLFLPLIGGTLIDRLNKYMMLMFTQFTLMILSFFLYLATKNGINSVHLEVLYIVVLMGILKTFDIPLRQTVMAHLVDKDKLRNATSIYSTIVNLSRFLGPFLFGVVVSRMSTFGIHRLDWLMVSKRFPWNAKYETVYRWFASFIVIYTIMELKS
jgi:MFS family permease